ncbi:unnamed protein product [Urochloa humidicola]
MAAMALPLPPPSDRPLTQLQIPPGTASCSFIPSHPRQDHRSHRRLPPVARRGFNPIQADPSQMAVLNLTSSSGGGDKENAPPPPAARGIAVKNQTAMKRRPGACGKAARRRPPLRDITSLFLAAPPPALPHAELLEAVSTPAGASDCVALKPGRYSLRKGFR